MNHDFSLLAGRLALACLVAAPALTRADAVTDWNTTAGEILVQARIGTPPATRTMAIVQTAVHEAVSAAGLQQGAEARTIAEAAAVAAANRATLLPLLPQQEAAIAAAYRAALAKLEDGPAKTLGIVAGERAAARVLAWRADDGAGTPERYRPHAAPGVYVPTAAVAVPQWPGRKPWLMAQGAQFRPGPPQVSSSAQWARDYDEVRLLGSRTSRTRTADQTDAAKFWDFSLPPVYHGVVRSAAAAPGRTVAQNARLFAAVSQAMDDGLIAVLDAKYHYNFWRPVTAIRNGDRDDHPGTEVEAGWMPLIDNPMHPEYPSAHSVLASAVGTVLRAEFRGARLPELATTSPTANGATRRWSSIDAFVQEVGDSRIWGGIHFRHAIAVGTAMGRQIGSLATAEVAQAPTDPQASASLAARPGP